MHSNAEEERVFSMVTKNKTKFRPSLKLDGTLASILIIKLPNGFSCTEFNLNPVSLFSTLQKSNSSV